MELKCNEKGRALIATKSIQSAELLLNERPVVSVVTTFGLAKVCSSCFKEGNVRKCTGCGILCYCSKACQKSDWRPFHKNECQKLKSEVSTLVRLAARLLQVDSVEFCENSDQWTLGQYGDIIDRLNWFTSEIYNRKQLCVALSKVQTNAFAISTVEENKEIGVGLYKIVAAMNHSCKPNAFYWHERNEMIVKAAIDVKKGDELFLAYIDVARTAFNRKLELKERYFFICDCNRCINGADFVETLVLSNNYLNALNTQNYNIALSVAEEILTLLKDAYHPLHPMIALKLLAVAKLKDCLNHELQEVHIAFLKAYESLYATFGDHKILEYPRQWSLEYKRSIS